MFRRFTKKRALLALSAIAALGIVTAAFAYFSNSGSGTGTASVGSVAAGDLSYAQNTLSSMYPGDTAQALTVTVTNNGTQKEYVNGVSAYVTTDKAGCDSSNFLLDGTPAPGPTDPPRGLGWTAQELAANGGKASTSGDTIQFNDKSSTNQNACQGATVTLHYASTA
jgi:hypothetical protein